MGRTFAFARSSAAAIATIAILGACGGGGGGEGGTTPPPANNNPSSIRLSQTGPISLASGATSSITAQVLTSDGRTLSGISVTWASTDATVAQVADGTITGLKVGAASVTATASGITSPALLVNVTPGALARVVITTQPAGAVVATSLATQPVVELRDSNDNVLTTSTAPVTAAIASGGGTLSGTSTVASVAGKATFADLAVTGLAGDRTLSFAVAGAPSVTSANFSLSPGAPSQIAIKTQPAGAQVAIPLATQPRLEVQDAGTNVIATATLPITVTIASGGGSLTGTTTVTSVAGVAQFTDLALLGLVGARTLAFTSPGIQSTTSGAFALSPGVPSQVLLTRQPVGGAIGAPLLVQPAVELRDVSGNVATNATAPIVATISFGGGTLAGSASVVPVNGVATYSNLAIVGSVGERELTFSVQNATPVTSSRFNLALIVYGTSGQKIQFIDVGATTTPTSSAGIPPTYLSRASSVAGVDNAGRITALKEGQSWIISTIPGGGDSVLTVVPRSAGGPVLRTNVATYSLSSGSVVTVDLVLDPRSTPVGAANVYVTAAYDTTSFGGTVVALAVPGSSVTLNQPTSNVHRFSIASAAGISAPVTFGRLQFTAASPGELLIISVTALDIIGPDTSDLMGLTTSTYYPMVIR